MDLEARDLYIPATPEKITQTPFYLKVGDELLELHIGLLRFEEDLNGVVVAFNVHSIHE